MDGGDTGTVPGMSVRTRLIDLDDAEAVRAIYNLEVVDSTVTMDLVPRTAEEQRAWIHAHRGAHGAIVAVDDDPVTGDER